MSRSRRILRIALIAGGLGQLPGVLLLASLIGLPRALAIAGAVSAAYCARILGGQPEDGEERGPMALLLLAFYAWWGASLVGALAFLPALLVTRLVPTAPPAAALALGAGLLAGLAGVTWNRVARLRTVEVALPGLDPALDGLRIAHLSDLHLGGHTTPAIMRRWVDRVNEAGADLVAVTGDLITMGDTHLERVAEELGRLRAADTIAVCLGNHDYFADTPRLVRALERAGLEVLRNHGRVVEREAGGRYYLGGADDTWSGRADVARTLAARPADLPASIPSLILAHDPNLFGPLAAAGASLVLSGHTHGGQVAVPFLARALNISRIAYRHTSGLYREGRAALYVSRGAGTTGPALRIGSPSELTLLVLRAA